jgi:photosystem II stability/assembly factor-like uncharacterized protein
MQKQDQRALIAAVLVLGLLANPSPTCAGGGVWTYTGLAGEYVNAVAVSPLSPATVYAGTRTGVFKTVNGGSEWVTQGLGRSYFVYAVAIDPVTPEKVWVGANGGVFRSASDGAEWARVFITITYSLAIDPVTPTTVYAGTNDGGVWKTVDGGAVWSPAASGLPGSPVRSLAIDPQATAILYAGTDTGIYKSVDGGSVWSPANSGIPPDLTYVYDLIVDPITPTTVYAGLYQFGVYKSTNGGESWSPASNGFPGGVGYAHEIVMEPGNPSILYAGLGDGVFKSSNGGGNWSDMSTGLTTRDVRSLAIDAGGPTLYAGSAGGGVFVRQPAVVLYLPLVRRWR